MNKLFQIQFTNGKTSSFALVYRYFDFLVYGMACMLSYGLSTMVPITAAAMVCMAAYMVQSRMMKAPSVLLSGARVMAVIHGCYFVMLATICFFLLN